MVSAILDILRAPSPYPILFIAREYLYASERIFLITQK